MKKYLSVHYFIDFFAPNNQYQEIYNKLLTNLDKFFDSIGKNSGIHKSVEHSNIYNMNIISHYGLDENQDLKSLDIECKFFIQKNLTSPIFYLPIISFDLYLSAEFEAIASIVLQEILGIFEGNSETRWIWESEYMNTLHTEILHIGAIAKLFEKNQNIFADVIAGKIKYNFSEFNPEIRTFTQMLVYFIYLIYINYKSQYLFKQQLKHIADLQKSGTIIDQHQGQLELTKQRLILNYENCVNIFEKYKIKLIGFLQIIGICINS